MTAAQEWADYETRNAHAMHVYRASLCSECGAALGEKNTTGMCDRCRKRKHDRERRKTA